MGVGWENVGAGEGKEGRTRVGMKNEKKFKLKKNLLSLYSNIILMVIVLSHDNHIKITTRLINLERIIKLFINTYLIILDINAKKVAIPRTISYVI